MITALLPPSSSSDRPIRAATLTATFLPIAQLPVAETSGTRSSLLIASPTSAPVPMTRWKTSGKPTICHDFAADVVHGDGGERRAFGGLPHDRVAADGGEGGIPRPNRDGKIEGGNHADDAERMPLLHHAVVRPFAGDRQSVKLPAEPHGEVADVDHLLDFAQPFAADLARLHRHQFAERRFLLSQRFAELPDRLSTHRCRNGSPSQERFMSPIDDSAVVVRRRQLHFGDRSFQSRD